MKILDKLRVWWAEIRWHWAHKDTTVPLLPSSVETSQPYIPTVTSTNTARASKYTITWATFSDFSAAVAVEQSNVTSVGAPVWSDGQELLNWEEPGIRRNWNLAGVHARNATIRPGLTRVLGSDLNRFWFVTGTPGASIGIDGDYGIDWTANALWFKSGGAWGSAGQLYPAGTSSAPTTAAALTDIGTIALPTVNAPLAAALSTKATAAQAAAAAPVQRVALLTGDISAAALKTALLLTPADIPSTPIADTSSIPFRGSFVVPTLITLTANRTFTADNAGALPDCGGTLDIKLGAFTVTMVGIVPFAGSVGTFVGGNVVNSVVFNRTASGINTFAVTQPST